MEGAIIGIMCDRNTVMFMPYYFLDTDSLLSLMSYSYNKKTSDLAFEHGGRPLGFGAFFAANLEIVRGKDATKQMKRIKKALDKNEIMNPGQAPGDEDALRHRHLIEDLRAGDGRYRRGEEDAPAPAAVRGQGRGLRGGAGEEGEGRAPALMPVLRFSGGAV